MGKVVLHGNHLDMVGKVTSTPDNLLMRINCLDNISHCIFEDSTSNNGLEDFA